MIRSIPLFTLIILLMVSCGTEKPENHKPATERSSAEKIVDKAIAVHGGRLYDSVQISFTFRDKYYTATRDHGMYTYTREYTDTTGIQLYDKLDNQGFYRRVDNKEAEINEEMAGRYSQSINSVWYFALLPFPLADPAVNLEHIGSHTVKGKLYDLVQVTFNKEGGGQDYSDVFLYWFEEKTKELDYLAYSYETEGGGIRFREAINRRSVNGIVFYDYINYKPAEKDIPLQDLDSLFLAGQLTEVSRIILEDVEVRPGV